MPYCLPHEGRVASQDKFRDEYRSLIDQLVAERKSRALTQWDVARAMRTDQSQVSKLERGERRVDIIDFVRYCRAIGIQPGKWLEKAIRAAAL